MTAVTETGRGVARTMCEHSLGRARGRKFRAMQFNFVVSTNERAVRLWQSFNFQIVGRLSKAFLHPMLGHVDAFVMYRDLWQICADARAYATHAACPILPPPSNVSLMN
jgi:hypothetical protein